MDADLSPLGLAANVAEFSLEIDGEAPELFHVVGIDLTEAVSSLFEARLQLVSEDPAIKLGALLGKMALLKSISAMGTRYLHGMIQRATARERSGPMMSYGLVLVPELWRLSRRVDCRIFQAKSTKDILTEVLEGMGLSGDKVDLRLSRSYQPRDYCVQYRESDLDFISRLMEEEGIMYWFSHTEGGHTAVFADDGVAVDELAESKTVHFREPRMGGGHGQFIAALDLSHTVDTGKVTLRDYTFKRPAEPLEVGMDVAPASILSDEEASEAWTELEVYDYPGEYVDEAVGDELARIRAESLLAQRVRAEGRSDVRRLVPGSHFALVDHPRESMNREWMVLEVTHAARQPSPDNRTGEVRYENRITLFPADLPYRPPRRTPRPTIAGLQTAVVTGPSGEEIHVDEFGRIRVQFHWDRIGQRDENSSCWVRVSHPSAGKGFGQVILPRVGQEVIVQFIEGDPDRPMVTGRLYNAEQTYPRALPEGKAHSTVKSYSYPSSGGFNEFTIDDSDGAEMINITGQKDYNITIGNNKSQKVAVDETHSVGSNRSTSIGSNETLAVTGDRSVTVDGKQDVTIEADSNHTVNSGNHAVTVSAGSHTLTANTDISLTSSTANIKTNSSVNTEMTVGADFTQTVTSTTTLTTLVYDATASDTATITGVSSLTLLSDTEVHVEAPTVSTNGTSKVTIDSPEITITGASKITLVVGGNSIVIDSAGITISGTKLTSAATAVNAISGSMVTLN